MNLPNELGAAVTASMCSVAFEERILHRKFQTSNWLLTGPGGQPASEGTIGCAVNRD